MRQAQSNLWWYWAFLLVMAIINMAVLFYGGYWLVQLMKAVIRALDRWNPPVQKRAESSPAKVQSPSILTDELKYAPKL